MLDDLRAVGWDPPGDLRTVDDYCDFAYQLGESIGTVKKGQWTGADLYKRAMGIVTCARREAAIMHSVFASGRHAAAEEGRAAKRTVKTEIALDRTDYEILRALAEDTSRLFNLYELESGTHISRKTIGKKIDHMLSAGLVSRPKGPKDGAKITSTGTSVLSPAI